MGWRDQLLIHVKCLTPFEKWTAMGCTILSFAFLIWLMIWY